GAERATLSPDRRSGSAPSFIASQQPTGADRSHVEDQPVSYVVGGEVSGEASRDAGRWRDVARSHDDPLWLGHFQQHTAFGQQSADTRAGWCWWTDQRRQAYQLFRQAHDG